MENAMKWETPVLCEVSVGMEVTSYQSADDSESIDSEIGSARRGKRSGQPLFTVTPRAFGRAAVGSACPGSWR